MKTASELNGIILIKEYKIQQKNMEIYLLEKEIERLHSIIKEVRKYIEKNTDNTNFLEVPSKELLEILDKDDKDV